MRSSHNPSPRPHPLGYAMAHFCTSYRSIIPSLKFSIPSNRSSPLLLNKQVIKIREFLSTQKRSMTAKLIIASDREKISFVIKLIGTSAVISSDIHLHHRVQSGFRQSPDLMAGQSRQRIAVCFGDPHNQFVFQ